MASAIAPLAAAVLFATRFTVTSSRGCVYSRIVRPHLVARKGVMKGRSVRIVCAQRLAWARICARRTALPGPGLHSVGLHGQRRLEELRDAHGLPAVGRSPGH